MTPCTTASRPRPGRRPIGLLIAAVSIAVGTYVVPAALDASRGSAMVRPLAVADLPSPAPSTLLDPGTDAATPADADRSRIDGAIEVWSANLARSERDFIAATNLAALYHARGRLTADLADYERAAAAAAHALDLVPGHAPARVLAAQVRFSLHDFVAALSIAEALLRDDPSQVAALATAADSLLELGRLDEAEARYADLATVAEGPALEARQARFAYATGRPDHALALARSAFDGALRDPTAHDIAFYHGLVGELARLTGDAALARSSFSAALAARPSDLAALVGLARIDAFDGRTAAAIAGLEHAAAIAPQPETLVLLADLQQTDHDAAAAATTRATLEAIRRLGDASGTVYDRILIRDRLDHPDAGIAQADVATDLDDLVDQAGASLADRPDSAGHDLLAWALHRAGRDDEAAVESRAALATGIVDARILFHAAAIDLATGDTALGRARLRAALTLGPALDRPERAEADRLLGAATARRSPGAVS